MPKLTIDSLTVHYEDQGKGDPVILLHGFPLDGRVWQSQAALLSDAYRVVRIDLPGFGQSSLGGDFTIASLADSVKNVADSLNLHKFVLGGLSMGGYVAFAYVRKYAADLAGLILADTRAVADTPQGKVARDQMAQLSLTQGARAIADQMEAKMMCPQTIQGRPAIYRAIRQIMESCPPQTIAQACIAMRDRPDSSHLLTQLDCPTLIVCGSEDVLTGPELSRNMQQAIRSSHLEIIPGAGHMSPMEQPEDVTSVIRTFLNKVFNH